MEERLCHVVIVGMGVAGLSMSLAFDDSVSITLVSEKEPLASGSTPYAQGGIAFSERGHEAVFSHVQDTLIAGAGLCDHTVVQNFIQESKKTITWLQQNGVKFDINADGSIKKRREAAHSVNRIAHIDGDSTGISLSKSLYKEVQKKTNITCLFASLSGLCVDSNGGTCGIQAGKYRIIAPHVVFATGGASGIFGARTAPAQPCTAFALALKAGALASDMEFFQHHPTALDLPMETIGYISHLPLISESVRGYGAKLITAKNCPLEIEHSDGPLAPRDVVSRAVFMARQRGRRVYLDTTGIKNFTKKFPTVTKYCNTYGVDTKYIPVRNAVHYQIGGIASTIDGKTNIPGLYVIGEAATTGLHGANRLASNSLLEAATMGINAAKTIEKFPINRGKDVFCFTADKEAAQDVVRSINDRTIGIIRDASTLYNALLTFSTMAQRSNIIVSEMATLFALLRQESIGCHYRSDYPAKKIYPRRFMNEQQLQREMRQIL